ncbi:MAG: serine/threonine protein kinase [Myxococcota bacterium]|nr:serine/threonine protein kinase [Myxococcota bacterium]
MRARRSTLVGTDLDGRFHIDAKIAEGGFGSVYRATHLASKHVVALKVLHAELAVDENLSTRFRREGEMLSSLSSPHTVSVYEVGEADDGTLYIAMELLCGESLLDRLRARGPLPWRGVLEIMKQVCRSLGEAHALGIVHRDLKPANINLEQNDYVKVLDFGIAKLLRGSEIDDGDDLTRVGQAVGTLEYMAPEQLLGAACDGRSDIYALGVVVYEILTGRRPYADATGPTSLVAAVMTQPLVPPSALFACGCIPPEVDRLVLRCLAKDPKDRFASVGDVIKAIDELLVPLARGSWSTELADEDTTWIDVPPAAPVAPPMRITPSRQPVMYDDSLGFAHTHMQAAISPTTNPGFTPPTGTRSPLTPTRALARGSSTPYAEPRSRARRESDLELEVFSAPRAEFAEGSRVRPRPTPDPYRAPTGSVPLVLASTHARVAPSLPAPTVTRLATNPPTTDPTRPTRPLSAVRVLVWTIVLLVGGAGVGMAVASLIG